MHRILTNGELKSLVLYGSRAYGKPRPNSDIDWCLVYDRATPEQEAWLADVTEDLPYEPPLHVFLYRADELAQHLGVSPLIYNVAHRGILLEGAPVPKLEIDRQHVAERNMALAREELASAQLTLSGNFYRRAISQSYYAVLYAVDAALATKGFVPKSHAGSDSLFGRHFLKGKLVDARFKGLVKRAAKIRIKADYDRDADFARDDAEYWFARAKEFVEAIEPMITQWLAEK
ncbi:MAG: HEPN domain-containing protein [Chloroflexota bacterium]|nr:HEPN domain-containing protein [Chloroflexota bacterium]